MECKALLMKHRALLIAHRALVKKQVNWVSKPLMASKEMLGAVGWCSQMSNKYGNLYIYIYIYVCV